MNKPVFLQHIGHIRKELRREFESRAAGWDITVAQFQVLRRLWSGDGVGTLVLSRETTLDAGTITGVLDRLETKGLIERVRNASDRREVRVVLTEQGRALEAPLGDVLSDINERALAGLSESQRRELMAMLEVVRKNLEGQSA